MNLNFICLISLILFILFETNALIEYSKKLNFNLPFKQDYLDIIEHGGQVHYLTFIRKLYDNFWVNLFTCYICISVWLSLAISILFFNLNNYPQINVGGLIGYLILKILNKYSS